MQIPKLKLHEHPWSAQGAHASHAGTDVPLHALVVSLFAFSVTAVVSYFWPSSLGDVAALVWVLALIPPFQLAYHKSWRGAAAGLAGSMVLMIGIQVVVVTMMGKEVDWRLTGGLTVLLIVVSLGAGWLAEMFHRRQRVVADMAYTDELTGLANRRALLYSLSHHFAAAKRGIKTLTVVMFDLDGFKEYNDRYGHSAGDEALRIIGQVLWENTRASDMTGRYGGDEFLSLLPDASAKDAHTFAQRVSGALQEADTASGDTLTLSAGVATFDASMFVMRDLVAAADLGLYEAKSKGGNTCATSPLKVAPNLHVIDGDLSAADIG
ncbi:MAG: GGDEF domain-containing protein [Gemmatimonadota bacterium]